MKIKKVIDLCKAGKYLYLFNDNVNGIQWLSDGVGFYPLFNMPMFSEDTVCSAYELDKDKMILESGKLPLSLNFSDCDENETELSKMDLRLFYNKETIAAYKCDTGMIYMAEKYMVPLTDMDAGTQKIMKRVDTAGNAYFVVKNGLLISAVICRCKVEPRMVAELEAIYRGSKIALENDKGN